MFERYTERARRAIFFARYEASQRNASAIDTRDLVLGLTRDKHKPDCPFLFLHERANELRTLLTSADRSDLSATEKIERDLPLTSTGRRAIRYAAKEADRDARYGIDAEHLFRGVLLTGDATASKLIAAGWTLASARADSKLCQRDQPDTQPARVRLYRAYSRRTLLIVGTLIFVAAILYMHFQQ